MFNSLIKNDAVMRVLHTFWQAFLAVFLIGITGILSTVLVTHSLSDSKSALIALIIASIAAGFSALKGVYKAKS